MLLKKAICQYSKNLNVSGSLTLTSYGPRRGLYIEWKPNENILIAHDTHEQGESWALVDTIAQRPHTIGENKTFEGNSKHFSSCYGVGINSNDVGNVTVNSPTPSNLKRNHLIQMPLDTIGWIEVKQRSQMLRFVRKSDKAIALELFFQHGNANPFIRQMRHLHVIERPQMCQSGSAGNEKYVILPSEDQKLRKTFVELDIGDIKSISLPHEGWRIPHSILSNLLSNFSYAKANRNNARSHYRHYGSQITCQKTRSELEGGLRRPMSMTSPSLSILSTSMVNENYDMLGLSDESTSDNSGTSGSDKSTLELDCTDVMIEGNQLL